MSAERGVTVFVPALNEEQNLAHAVESVLEAARTAGSVPVEVLIINDGSNDGTARVIRDLEKKHDVVRSIHHERNTGWGVSFSEAVQAARYPKLALYPGDGMVSTRTLRDMIRHAYVADFVCAYTANTEARTGFRNFVSSLYTLIYKATFNVPIRYINATPVYPVELLRTMKLKCRRYSFPSEVNVKVLRLGSRFVEIPGYHNPRNMTSSALRLKNLIEVIQNYVRLIVEIYVTSRQAYSRKPVRVDPLKESENE